MSTRRRHIKIIFIILVLILFELIWITIKYRHSSIIIHRNNNDNNNNNIDIKYNKIDWNNYDLMRKSFNRSGLGENGMPVLFDDYRKELYENYGFEAILSDMISLNRTVPDIRPADCKYMTYLEKLPKTGIIIIFYNERLSVLLRTIWSILNRTSAELIQEIILIDDGSDWPEVHAPLNEYMKIHFPPDYSKVRLLRLRNRNGLMVARMVGARNASKESEVLIFLDSHFEMMYNWLPPLLEPIAMNPKACTVPTFDKITFKTFAYQTTNPYRGYFDWNLNYQWKPLHKEELLQPAKNFYDYVMMGGALAIRADYFWELGGFDEGMLYWGGEQFELSFKIWMCGGELIKVPCSRMGHLYRDPKTKGNKNLYNDYSFLNKNVRRVIDVWLDKEHRQYVLNHRKGAALIDPGDLSERYALRDRLQCKNFSWMIEHKMPDLKRIFPPVEPPDHGYGTLRSFLYTQYCIALDNEKKIILQKCQDSDNWQQIWYYTWRCEFRVSNKVCMEVDLYNRRVGSYNCHLLGGNQKWFYDIKKHWLVHLNSNMCMVANIEKFQIDLAPCDNKNFRMRWLLRNYNETTLNECHKS